MHKHLATFSVYTHPKIIVIVILGFVSGLPLALTSSTLFIWLREAEISLTSIGFAAAIGTPYAIKFLWAPLVDQLPFPLLTKALGRRRSWLIVSECGLIFFLIALAMTDPQSQLWFVALFALFVAIFSATQDIVIDAYRVEFLEENQQGAGAASIVFGYRIGMLVSGAGALFLASTFDWSTTYIIMAALVPIGTIVVLFAGEPEAYSQVDSKNWQTWFLHAVIEPFKEFMTRSGWWLILLFIILYKFGDAFAGVITGPFLIDLGFSKEEYATVVKLYGVIATLAGAFVGGAIVFRYSILRSLLICGILQMISNLMFVYQAYVGYDISVLTLTITIENFSGGMGTAAFVAFLSQLCNRQFTATQYALFSALAATGRTWLSTSSGVIADLYGYIPFFIISTLVAIPGLLLLIAVRKYLIQDHAIS